MKTHVSVRGSVYIPGPHSSRFASRVSYSGDSTRSTMNDVNGRTTSSVSADLALSPTFSDVATASAASSSSRFDVARAIREARRVRQPPRQRLKEDLEEEEEEEEEEDAADDDDDDDDDARREGASARVGDAVHAAVAMGAARGGLAGLFRGRAPELRCVLYKSCSPIARFQHLIASLFN